MKIFTSAQIRELDRYTIEHEPIQSIDLMEKSSFHIGKNHCQYMGQLSESCRFCRPWQQRR